MKVQRLFRKEVHLNVEMGGSFYKNDEDIVLKTCIEKDVIFRDEVVTATINKLVA